MDRSTGLVKNIKFCLWDCLRKIGVCDRVNTLVTGGSLGKLSKISLMHCDIICNGSMLDNTFHVNYARDIEAIPSFFSYTMYNEQ